MEKKTVIRSKNLNEMKICYEKRNESKLCFK